MVTIYNLHWTFKNFLTTIIFTVQTGHFCILLTKQLYQSWVQSLIQILGNFRGKETKKLRRRTKEAEEQKEKEGQKEKESLEIE